MPKILNYPRFKKDATCPPRWVKLNYTLDPNKDAADPIVNFLLEDGSVVSGETKKERYELVDGKYRKVKSNKAVDA
jgi:hypothetical protein